MTTTHLRLLYDPSDRNHLIFQTSANPTSAVRNRIGSCLVKRECFPARKGRRGCCSKCRGCTFTQGKAVEGVTESLTSIAWSCLSAHFGIAGRLEAGEVISLSADEIKEVGRREPRLMTKFDTRESRPPQLACSTILPTSNGQYSILAGDGYSDFAQHGEAKRWPLDKNTASIRTLPWSTGPSSESQALDMAMASGILGDFLADSDARLTVRGRLRSPKFGFNFQGRTKTTRLEIDGVQIEVDSGLEGNSIHLVEAKLGSRTNFHVRQIYYPFRMWRIRIPDKPVTTSMLTWSNKRFALRRYEFTDEEDYHSLHLAAAIDYVFEEAEDDTSLAQVLEGTRQESLPVGVPFPQADDMAKVIDVVDAVGSGCRDQPAITERYDFDARQANYYGNAGTFLGLLHRDDGGFALTDQGDRFVASSVTKRRVILSKRMASLPVLRSTLVYVHDHGEAPATATVAGWIASATSLGGSTAPRRARTVLAWVKWATDIDGGA